LSFGHVVLDKKALKEITKLALGDMELAHLLDVQNVDPATHKTLALFRGLHAYIKERKIQPSFNVAMEEFTRATAAISSPLNNNSGEQ